MPGLGLWTLDLGHAGANNTTWYSICSRRYTGQIVAGPGSLVAVAWLLPIRVHFPPIPPPGSSGPAVMLCNHSFCHVGGLLSSDPRCTNSPLMRWIPFAGGHMFPRVFNVTYRAPGTTRQTNPDLLKISARTYSIRGAQEEAARFPTLPCCMVPRMMQRRTGQFTKWRQKLVSPKHQNHDPACRLQYVHACRQHDPGGQQGQSGRRFSSSLSRLTLSRPPGINSPLVDSDSPEDLPGTADLHVTSACLGNHPLLVSRWPAEASSCDQSAEFTFQSFQPIIICHMFPG